MNSYCNGKIHLKVTLSKATFLLFQIIYRSLSWKCHFPTQKKSAFLSLKPTDVIIFGKGSLQMWWWLNERSWDDISRWTLNAITMALKERGQEEMWPIRESDMTTEGRTGVMMWPHVKECCSYQKLEEAKRWSPRDSCLKKHSHSTPDNDFSSMVRIFRLLASKTVRK